MKNDIFGNQQSRLGAHIPSQEEWNQLNNSITNVQIGNNSFYAPQATPAGMSIPADAFFFPHVASIDGNYTDAIIGPNREEDFYPFVDSLAVESTFELWTFTIDNGVYRKTTGVDTINSTRSVLFKLPNTLEPTKPIDPLDGAVVGYRWDLTPFIVSIGFSDDMTTMSVGVAWVAKSTFDPLIPNAEESLYSEDLGTSESSWAPSSTLDESEEFDGLEMINDWLTDHSQDPVDMSEESQEIFSGSLVIIIIKIPVARYDWDHEQEKLERCIQLLFGNTSPGGGSSGSSAIDDPGMSHPFKSQVKPGEPGTITVGYLRSDWKDSITIEDPETDLPYAIEFADPEDIALNIVIGDTSNYYVYYDIHKNGSVWESELKKSSDWPPTVKTGNIIIQIGYAIYVPVSGETPDTYIWQQHMYECPRETVQEIRGEFAPWYASNGSVTIAAGNVDDFNNDLTGIPEKTFDLAVDTEIWVEVKSTSSSTPSVAISGLKNGTYPGLYKVISTTIKDFNYKIGEIANSVYTPSHTGRLQLSNTMLMPSVSDDYTASQDEPRMMILHDDQVVTVGDVANDTLLDAKKFNVAIRGGGVQKMSESTAIKFYGLTQNESEIDLVAVDGVDGSGFGDGSISLTPQSLDREFDHGLVQKSDYTPDSDITIQAGNDIQIDYLAGTATINGRVYTASGWLKKNGSEFVHINSPVQTTSDPNHWKKITIISGKIDDGSTVSIDIYVDLLGHIWKIDSDLQPPPEFYWRYEHCSEPETYDDLIFAAEQANDVILVDDECYKFIEETQDTLTEPEPTVTDTYSTCQICEDSSMNEQWKSCVGAVDIAVLTQNHTNVDWAWLCSGGFYIPCYSDSLTATVATDPTVLEQCGDTPTECADLVGWHASDNFSGVDCNSGVVGDTNWGLKFVESFNGTGTRTTAIISNVLNVTLRSSGATFYGVVYSEDVVSHSGEYTVTIDMTQIGPTTGTDNGIAFRTYHGGTIMRIISSIGGNFYDAGAESNVTAGTYQAASLTIKRIASGKIEFYQGVTLLGTSIGTHAGDLTKIEWQTFNRGTTDFTFKYNELIAEDGGGNDIIAYDPTGDACV